MVLFLDALLFAAAVTDITGRKVPNILILVGYGAGISGTLLLGGSLTEFIWNALRPILFLFPLYMIRAIGAADIKLVSVISVFLSHTEVKRTILGAVVIGGIISLMVMVRKRELIIRMKRVMDHLFVCIQSKRITSYKTMDGQESYIPMAVCIFLGYWLQRNLR